MEIDLTKLEDMLGRYRSSSTPVSYGAFLEMREDSPALASRVLADAKRLEAAAGLETVLREFVRRVEAGEVRSKRTYAAAQAALSAWDEANGGGG